LLSQLVGVSINMVACINYRQTESRTQRVTLDIRPVLAITYQTLVTVTVILLSTSIKANFDPKTRNFSFNQAIHYDSVPKWIWTIVNVATIFQAVLIKPATNFWFFNSKNFNSLIDENRKNLVKITSKNVMVCGVLSGVLAFLEITLSKTSCSNFEQVLLLFINEAKQLAILGEIGGFVVILGSIQSEKSNENTLKLYDVMVSLFVLFSVTNTVVFLSSILCFMGVDVLFFVNAVFQYVNLGVFYVSQFVIVGLVTGQSDVGLGEMKRPELVIQIE